MKKPKPVARASHVNFGTSVPAGEQSWPNRPGSVMRMPKLHVETEERAMVTRFGGLALAEQFCRRFGVAGLIDDNVEVLKLHLPYHESDHVLAQAMNLYVGGSCIEDMSLLQHDDAVLRMLGACRLPDPTTAGDFLRRFDRRTNPEGLMGLRTANDKIQERVWKRLTRRKRRRRKHSMVVIDVDSKIKPLSGEQKQGADFGYTGKWSYHPFMISMAETGECLAVRNRPGSATSAKGVEDVLDELLPRLKKHYGTVLLRGDSAFDRAPMRRVCQQHGVYFAFVSPSFDNRENVAEGLEFRPFRTREARTHEARRAHSGYQPRRKSSSHRKQRARERGYEDKQLKRQWLAETPYRYSRRHGPDRPTYRLVIRRQLIERHNKQQEIFDEYRYRYVLTNLPDSFTTEAIIDETYLRCDQENLIQQMGSGLAAWRMPVAEFDGNEAWLEIARLAWNMAKWIAQLALPDEVIRWKWKRFRLHYVFVPAQLIKRARQTWVRLMGARSTIDPLLLAFESL